MNLIKANNIGAFEELYDRYFNKIFNYLKAKSTTEVAEDLTQNCFIKVYEKSSTYKSDFPVSAWIYTIAKNLLMDEFRKSAIKNKYFDRLKEMFSKTDNIETKNLWNELMFDMRDLDQKSREILTLRFNEGMDFEEMAQRLNTNPINARKLVSRALKTLKSFLETGDSL